MIRPALLAALWHCLLNYAGFQEKEVVEEGMCLEQLFANHDRELGLVEGPEEGHNRREEEEVLMVGCIRYDSGVDLMKGYTPAGEMEEGQTAERMTVDEMEEVLLEERNCLKGS